MENKGKSGNYNFMIFADFAKSQKYAKIGFPARCQMG
jgi:hypothetical protein